MKASLKILIVENIPADAVLMEKEMKNAGIDFQSQQVDSLEDFKNTLKTFSPDLVLSDFSMNHFTAMDVLQVIHKLKLSIPFIVVTGDITEETIVEVMKAGATDYVLKDRLGRLVTAVQAAIEKQVAMKEKLDTEQALIASETQYRRLFEMAREGIFLLDNDQYKIVDANLFLLDLLEMDLEKIKNSGLVEIGIFQKKEEFENQFKILEKENYVHWDKLEIETVSGKKITTEMSCNSYMVDGEMTIQCNIRDISERIESESERGRIQAQLFQSQKMEAIGTLAGGIAHDFNNLMTAIQVSADMVLMNVEDDDINYKELQEIRFAALRAASLIRQLLLFSREHPMEFTPLQLNGIIENLVKMLKRLIGEDIKISTKLEKDLLNIHADNVNMEQVIMNLALNARDAMPKGGHIEIRTKNIMIDEDFCKTFTEARPGQFICLSIADTGTGMDEETLNRVFEPFFTTKAAGKGSGLGLAIVYGIVKQHNGWIHVQSSPGCGSTFQIYIPANEDPLEEKGERQERILALQGKGERILLVEDEDKVREFTKKALERCGYEVISTSNFEDAIQVFKEEKGNFSLVFSDVVLSDKTGIELAEKLIEQKNDIKILLTSGYLDHKSQWPLILEKGYRFLQKPYALADLLSAIQEIV